MSRQAKPRQKNAPGSTIAAARQNDILSLVQQGQVVAVGDFARRFSVSHETIRRDLRDLEKAGHVRRVHGGAAPTRLIDLSARQPILQRIEVNKAEKRLAAEAALGLFEDNMSVFLGGSSTTYFLAELLLRSGLQLNVTTNMIDIAVVLAEGPSTVVLLGGTVNPQNHVLGGAEMLKALERRLFDMSVIGASGIDVNHGVLAATAQHRIISSTLAQHSHRLACIVDSSKLGKSDANIILSFDQVDLIILDRKPEPVFQRVFDANGVTVVVPNGEDGEGS